MDPTKDQQIIFLCATTDRPNSIFNAGDPDLGQKAKQADLKNGIIYLEVGTDGTPVENISFTKTNQPYYIEAKGEQSGIKGEPLYLSEPYNCDFSIFGNNFIKPGMFAYIRLPHFGSPAQLGAHSRVLGLGGYFMVTKTYNSISLQGNKFTWKTSATCFWNSFGKDKQLETYYHS